MLKTWVKDTHLYKIYRRRWCREARHLYIYTEKDTRPPLRRRAPTLLYKLRPRNTVAHHRIYIYSVCNVYTGVRCWLIYITLILLLRYCLWSSVALYKCALYIHQKTSVGDGRHRHQSRPVVVWQQRAETLNMHERRGSHHDCTMPRVPSRLRDAQHIYCISYVLPLTLIIPIYIYIYIFRAEQIQLRYN